MKKPKTHMFRDREYAIHWRHPRGYPEEIGGSCSSPFAKKPNIEIDPESRGYDKMCILIDEAIHACLWDLDNESVGECSTSIGAFLWNCGARFIEDENS